MTERVSVVIPVYNRLADLAKCLTGLAVQDSAFDRQVVIVDDASPKQGIEDLAVVHGAQYIRLDSRCGSGYGKNIGVLNTDGDYVLFLDSDVEFINNSTLDTMLKALQRIPHCGAVGGEAILDQEGKAKYVFGRNLDLKTGKSRNDYIGVAGLSNPDKYWQFDYIPTSNCLVRRDTFASLDGFDDAYREVGEDKDFGYRLRESGLCSYVLLNGVVLHKFSANERPENVLDMQYRTQIRFCIRHFGVKASLGVLMGQTQDFVAAYAFPEAKDYSVDPAIRDLEQHYVKDLLGLHGRQDPTAIRRDALKNLLACWKAYWWNAYHRRGLRQYGSCRLPELAELSSS